MVNSVMQASDEWLTLSSIIMMNSETYFENCAVLPPQDF